MERRFIALFAFVCAAMLLRAQSVSVTNSVQAYATVQANPARITLNWASHPSTTGFTIHRKARTATTWGNALATLAGTATNYQDNAVAVGTVYEYRVTRTASAGTGYGYVVAGIEAPVTDYMGVVVLLVDNQLAASLNLELQQLQTDLKADGWKVVRHDVSRTASVGSVRQLVINAYNADPSNAKAVYAIGHVPVPYSGNINPDGHAEHQGAWPCDGYYGELNGSWTDASVNNGGAQRVANRNTPGDGKFDQSDFPSAVELAVGRVDMYDMPAFSAGEVQLMKNYLDRSHNFKLKGWTPTARGIVFDNLQWVANPLAGSGYKGIAPCVGPTNITDCYPYGLPYTTYVNNQSYLWTYSSGGGLQATDNGVLTYNGANNIATTQDFAGGTVSGGVFNMSFGSYFGDWDNRNNFLRSFIAAGQGLTSVWAGAPNWWFHPMGLGEHIGTSVLQSMNNGAIYSPQNGGWQGNNFSRVHMGLMGDPTLRMVMTAPPSGLSVTNSGGNAAFSWSPAAGAAGYYLYKFDASGVPQRIVPTMITGNSYNSPLVPFEAGGEYMVRAVKLETTTSGSYWNLSLGSIAVASGGPPPTDCLGVVGGPALPGTACNDGNANTGNDTWAANCTCLGQPIDCMGVVGGPAVPGASCDDGLWYTGLDTYNANCVCAGILYDCTGVPGGTQLAGTPCNDNNANTINDTWSANCVCTGTPATDSDGDGIPNANDNCPNTPGQIGSACNDNNVCTINDVLNASCVCAGTPAADTDGDGVCNAQDNCPTVVGQIGSACNDNNACTTNDVLNAQCQCVGTPVADTDGDGLCNAIDNCPNVTGQIGSACNDNNACTTNDVLNAQCQCVGTPVADTDGDGLCNAIDNCPNVTGQIGSACDDNNACTTNDVLNAQCQCAGTPVADTDGDGLCNAIDNCPNVAGQIGSACNDNNACTTNDVLNAQCQCAGTPVADTDGDGLCNAIDNCPNVAGQIGSACNDNNACTTNDVLNAQCQCVGTPVADTDGDGLCNAIDNCPNVTGQIGSACNDNNACTTNDVLNAQCQCAGTPVTDTDGDGLCNAVDNCPNVAGQIGSACNDNNACTTNDVLNAQCQCVGTPVADTDGDGLCNAIDNCPNVAGQIGSACNDNNACTTNDVLNAQCQCVGTPVADTDGDGLCNAIDNCPNVTGQIGSACNDNNACTTNDVLNAQCQCAGTPVADTDGDGLCNAIDNCPNTPGQIGDACNDGNANTVNDVVLANCTCAGTPVNFDCAGVANGTAAVDQCGVCAGGTTGIVPNSTCLDCLGVPNGAAQPGSACDDNDGNTQNDTWSANCQCIGTPVNFDCAGLANGTAALDQCGVCAGGTTGIVPNSTCLDCLGVPNGAAQPGSACDDNDGNTQNDTWSANCQCIGTPVNFDCAGVANGTAAIDQCGVCAGGTTGVVPNSTCLDCLGLPNGSAQPGSTCDDNNANTQNDTWTANCQCIGTPVNFDCAGVANGTASIDQCGVCAGGTTGIVPNSTCLDCLGVPNGAAQPGSACDDNNANTQNDAWNANCQCIGTPVNFDCAGVANGTAAIDQCGVCAGGTTGVVPNSTCLDCLGVPNGSAQPGSTCDDNNANTQNDTWTANCQCIGTPVNFDCAGVANGTASIDQCGVCAGGTTGTVPNSTCLDCLGVPNGSAQPGSACDDNNANTQNDTWNANCSCVGTPVNFDCAGVANGTAAVDQCGVCAGGTTGIVPNSTCLDCLGVPNGSAQPGSTCDDNNANTQNDTWDANCTCAGTPVNFDCAGVANGTAAVDQCGVCAGGTTGIAPNSTCLDCLGVPNGSAQPGSTCDDNNANTQNDTWDANCTCAGTPVNFDCAGVANGTAAVDQCGVCAGGTTGVVPNSTCLDCLGVPNGSAQPGSTCDDNNANTQNDTWTANCQCTGTPVNFDCAGVASGTAAIDQCGVCAGGTTGIVPNSTCLDCLGVPNGSAQPGASCNDNNANTQNDIWTANCTCAGTPVNFDCAGVANGTAAIDQCGVCAGGTTGVVPNSTCLDCLGVPNGSAQPGSTCDDSNANTQNDTWAANCQCIGTPVNFDCAGVANGTAAIDQCGVCAGGTTGVVPNTTCLDCLGVPNGSAQPGSTCDDNNGNTQNDTWNANCQCVGTPVNFDCAGVANGTAAVDQCGVCAGGTTGIVPNSTCLDCLGVPNGSAQPGSTCDDNNANTANDAWNNSCQCIGQQLDCLGIPNGTNWPGTLCDDGNPNTLNDTWSNSCACLGVLQITDCLGQVNGPAMPGTSCDDGNAATGDDVWGVDCICAGLLIDCMGVPGGSNMPGSLCNDNNPNTSNDSWTINCQCVGFNNLVDCAGVIGGGAFFDDCGVCAGGNTGIIPNPDSDGDGLLDCADNCPTALNPDQEDFDQDGAGDGCDNCPWVSNPMQEDLNGNGIGDACETVGVGIDENTSTTLSAYPNPVRDELTLTGDLQSIASIELYTLLGQRVWTSGPARTIDTDGWATGIYYLIALNADGRPLAQIRLVKQ